jgi:2,5-diamino-6-(ribosylamino)-4(3H)-pyrimidinone 5'-phosphate reductase
LSAHLKGKEEKILKILEVLKEESAKGTPIIVEGKNDIETLRTLGIEGKITSAKTGGKSFLDLVSEIERTNAQETILLLDFDRRGKQLTKKLKQHMDKTGMKLNINFWLELLALLSTQVKDVEGLASYMETLKRKTSNS